MLLRRSLREQRGAWRATVRRARKLAMLGSLTLTSCTLLLQRERDQCHSSEDCQALATGAVCTSEGICVTTDASLPSPSCTTSSDCAPGSVCGAPGCQRLDELGCTSLGPAADPNGALLLGVLTTDPTDPGQGDGWLAAFRTSIGELEAAVGNDPDFPKLAVFACDENDSAAIARLTEARVSIVLGPTHTASLQPALTALAGGAVVFAPSAEAPVIEDWQQAGLSSSLVSCKPNRADSETAWLSGRAFVKQQLVAHGLAPADGATVVAISDDEANLGYDAESSGAEPDDGSLTSVEYDSTGRGSGLEEALAEAMLAPTLLVAPSAEEEWNVNIGAVDGASAPTGHALPYYLLSDEQAAVLTLLTQNDKTKPPEFMRVSGLAYHLSDANSAANAEFAADFLADTGGAPNPGLEYMHDCTFTAIYAALAGMLRYSLAPAEVTPAAVLVGLRALSGGDTSLAVGGSQASNVLATLGSARGKDASLSLVGASGDLGMALPTVDEIIQDPVGVYARPAAADEELYCIDASQHLFCRTGLIFSNSGSPPDTSTQTCSCFPTP
jgi:hypothetical protein